ncbi:MAG: hypothetical protein HQK67_06220 [Desulfamplus sp.]|nr:hypothetical protein [Desulfamplus sp.]
MNKLSTNNTNSPVSELKHLMLSIDNGITNEVSQSIIKITEGLGKQWQRDKVLLTFIKMTRALIEYAVSQNNNFHKDTVPMINSLVNQMDNLSSSSGKNLPDAKKQALLSEEIAKYNKLKQQIKSTPRQEISDKSSASQAIIIAGLKSAILSLDWEITEELIQKLESEAIKLQTYWQNSKIHLAFLQMFRSIGNYVLNKGSNTHPDSISLLNSLYTSFERIVLNPTMTMSEQKEILLREMKKFNTLKQTISSSKAPPTPKVPKERPSVNLMDDLMGTKTSNLSPVDDLIEEIHMLQDSGTRTHSLDATTASHTSSSSNPEIKEVIPNRLKKQPILEIETRLDAFFNEDESLSELSFADSGEEVVPYKSDKASYGPDDSDQELILSDDGTTEAEVQELAFKDDSASEWNELSFEEDDYSKQDIDHKVESAIKQPPTENRGVTQPSENISITQPFPEKMGIAENEIAPGGRDKVPISDGMVPYDFQDEFFDDDIDIETDIATDIETPDDNQKEQSLNMQRFEDKQDRIAVENAKKSATERDTAWDQDSETNKDMEMLEDLKSTLAQCMFHGGVNEIEEINKKILALEQLWVGNPEKLILLKMVKSLTEYFDLLSPEPQKQTLDLMLYIVQSLGERGIKSAESKSSENKSAKKFNKNDLLDVFSKYIDFQSIMVKKQISTSQLSSQNKTGEHVTEKTMVSDSYHKPENLIEQELLYDKSREDMSDIEKKLTEPRGLWSKFKKWLGF